MEVHPANHRVGSRVGQDHRVAAASVHDDGGLLAGEGVARDLQVAAVGAADHRLVGGLGIESDRKAMEAALDAASVDRMREVESASGVGQPQAYDFDDPNARRVRKARVGSWREEMDDDTIALLIGEIESRPAARDLLEALDLMPGSAAV